MTTLRIAVLGAGKIGGTLGRKWVDAGHDVVFGVRDLEGDGAQALRAEPGERTRVATIADAVAIAEVVLLAVPGRVAAETATRLGAALDGKTVIDATNNMGAPTINSVAAIQAAAPDARVFRAFNCYGWENFADPVYDGGPADLFYAGPAGEAGAAVERLIGDVGLRPVRLGDSDQAGLTDDALRLWFGLVRGGHGRHIAFRLLGA
ncbi:MAG TPA: NAD(P)-binding domain-containing protein [Terriglobales bacterium]|nr:NAD(P)-binding domain-containing protein [Terriglobales bacterium]